MRPVLPLREPEVGIISDMVAPRDVPPAPLHPAFSAKRSSYIDLPHTKLKLKPRAGASPLWRHELNDLLSQLSVAANLLEETPPMWQSFKQQSPTTDIMTLTQWHQSALHQWWEERTVIYYVVFHSLDLSGPMEAADLQMIRKRCHVGDKRDGRALLEWALSFKADYTLAGQSELIDKVQSAKLTGTPAISAFTLHTVNLLNNWCAIEGNSVAQPGAFYLRLMRSIDGAPDGSKLSMLHSWVAQKVTDEDPLCADPQSFVDKLNLHASNIGLKEGSGSLLVTGRQSNCSLCSSVLCNNHKGTPDKCLCLKNKPFVDTV